MNRKRKPLTAALVLCALLTIPCCAQSCRSVTWPTANFEEWGQTGASTYRECRTADGRTYTYFQPPAEYIDGQDYTYDIAGGAVLSAAFCSLWFVGYVVIKLKESRTPAAAGR